MLFIEDYNRENTNDAALNCNYLEIMIICGDYDQFDNRKFRGMSIKYVIKS